MAKIPQTFEHGMNQDLDSRVLKGYRHALNSRAGTSETHHLKSLENVLGTILIPYTLPSGNNRCIGSCEDIANDAIIYFVYNDSFQHSILRFNKATNSITRILQQGLNALWTIDLKFSTDHLINHANVIENLLYWTDGFNPPRKINIDKAIGYTNNPIWNFSDNQYYTNTSISQYGMVVNQAYVSLQFAATTMPTNLSAGSLINIQQYAGALNPQYNGLATVAVVDNVNFRIVTNILWGINTPTNPGNISLFVPFNPPLTQAYSIINEQVIDRIKHPPLASPLASYQNDYTYHYNNLRGSTFQFAYAYVYDDNEQTVQSPISKLPVPQNENTLNGNNNPDNLVNNRLDILLETGIDTIKTILIYGRSNAETTDANPVTVSANYGYWYLIDRIERYDENGKYILDNSGNILLPPSSQYTYQFFNDKIQDIVDPDNAARLFDYVPQICGASEIIEKNRIIDGDITEGYDNVDVDVKLSVRKIPISYFKTPFTIIPTIKINASTLNGIIELPSITDIQEGDTIQIVYSLYYTATGGYSNYIVSYTITHTAFVNYPLVVLQGLLSEIIVNAPSAYILSNQIIIPHITIPYVAQLQSLIGSILPFWGGPVVKTAKSGATHTVGVIYFDRANRSGATNKSNQATVYVPLPTEKTENTAGVIGLTTANQSVIDWEINNIPPIWATHYQWVYGGSNIESFIQYHPMQVFPDPNFADALNADNAIYIAAQNTISNGQVRIKLGKALIDYKGVCNKSLLSYIWQKGDRCRFILKGNNSIGSWTYFTDDASNSWAGLIQLDYEIISYDATLNEIVLEYDPNIFEINKFLYPHDQFQQHSVVEVYTPKKNIQEKIFYEIGECFEIGDAGLSTRYHKGSVNNQVFVSSSSIVDSILIRIDIVKNISAPGYFNIVFVINNPYSSSIPPSFFNIGNTIQIVGLTNTITPSSVFLNGNYTIATIVTTVPGEFQIYVTQTVYLPSLPLFQYLGYYNCVHGYIPYVYTIPIQPARGTFDFGDCYLRLRWTAVSADPLTTPFDSLFEYFPCESNSVSDFYISDSYDKGRPNLVDRNMKQRRLIADMRWSDVLVQDTQINGLSTFEVLNELQLSDKFGAISKIIESGIVLKVLQQKKVPTVYVGVSKMFNQEGQTTLSDTDAVLGTVESPVEMWGTTYPESVVNYNRYVYFWDGDSGEVIRDSPNGMFPVSSYGRVQYFKQWRDEMKAAQVSYAFGAWEEDKKQYILTLYWMKKNHPNSDILITTSRFETVAFYEGSEGEEEGKNEWKSDYSFTPEHYGYSKDALLSFVKGECWLHNSNPIHNSFYNTKYPQQVTFVINPDPISVKRFLALAFDSNMIWSAVKIRIPANEEYPLGMESRLIESKFRLKEGFYYAEFLKDMNTPNFSNAVLALINGRDLRGRVIEITLENGHDEHVVLFSAYVNLIQSALSGIQ